MRCRYAWAPVALMIAANSLAPLAAGAAPLAVLPADSVLKVRLNDTIGSDRSLRGDRFTATVEDPSLPSGTLVRGVITDVTPGDRDIPGRLAVDFRTLEMPDGRRFTIDGAPTALDSRNVRTSATGRLVSRSHSSKPDRYLGYGAAGGLAIGSLVGKNVVGGLLGAGAGFLFGKHKEKKAEERRNVVLKEGTEMGVRLDQQVALAGF
jgi:hypothetical protein